MRVFTGSDVKKELRPWNVYHLYSSDLHLLPLLGGVGLEEMLVRHAFAQLIGRDLFLTPSSISTDSKGSAVSCYRKFRSCGIHVGFSGK